MHVVTKTLHVVSKAHKGAVHHKWMPSRIESVQGIKVSETNHMEDWRVSETIHDARSSCTQISTVAGPRALIAAHERIDARERTAARAANFTQMVFFLILFRLH